MTPEERREARRAFESWSAINLEMIDDGSHPANAEQQADLRDLLTGPLREMVWMIFLAGFMSVEIDED